jgi:cytochrome c oxidase subunit 2
MPAMDVNGEPARPPELAWLGVLGGWAATMLGALLLWHGLAEPGLANEAYPVAAADYAAKAAAMNARYEAGEVAGDRVVRPPAGSDVYLLARGGRWWPVVELEAGASYRLHLAAADAPSAFAIDAAQIAVAVHPGYELVLPLRLPDHDALARAAAWDGGIRLRPASLAR